MKLLALLRQLFARNQKPKSVLIVSSDGVTFDGRNLTITGGTWTEQNGGIDALAKLTRNGGPGSSSVTRGDRS